MPKNPEEIYVDGTPFFSWRYEEQTAAKHKVLFKYIDCWIKILGKYNKLNYFDCYSGCGSYTKTRHDLYFGSPIEVSRIANQNLKNLGRQVKIIAIEKDKRIIDNLEKVIEYCKLETKPVLINDDFDSYINLLFETKKILAPSFFFIDPFGYSLSIKTIERMMNNQKSEIFINFMYNDINRFIGKPEQENTMNRLFGCSEWRNAISLSSKIRENFIVGLFIKQVKLFSKYAYPYRITFPNKQRTYYYLIHLSNNLKGSSIMKSAFCNLNSGRVEYLGHIGSNLTIFDMTEYKINDIISYFNNDFWSNNSFTYNKIIDLSIDSTPYTESEIKKALKALEASRKIDVTRVTSKKTGMNGEDIICFMENENGNF